MGEMAENTPNAPKIFSQICLPKPKSLGFSKKILEEIQNVTAIGMKKKLKRIETRIENSK